ncbi:MAG TPA: hypothetical protein PLM14_06780 [Candidatus Hydrogenedentes bacterium]|nr:hypothetical protein [Candidatus Hydrogenedentota bacterium]HQH51913.1 hypothetical protein [Candidatus Hydrogenedentota bacterium]
MVLQTTDNTILSADAASHTSLKRLTRKSEPKHPTGLKARDIDMLTED